jgi:hypothetical protein
MPNGQYRVPPPLTPPPGAVGVVGSGLTCKVNPDTAGAVPCGCMLIL